MSENTYTLTPADFADILTSSLALAAEAGLTVGIRNATANEKRPEGLLIYVSGLRTDGTGAILAANGLAVAGSGLAPEEAHP
jgi:hypothetical protein